MYEAMVRVRVWYAIGVFWSALLGTAVWAQDGSGEGDCCAAHETPGCEDATCRDSVCAVDPYCCETEWDDVCAEMAWELCPELNCGGSLCPGEGSACEAHGTGGCEEGSCCELICAEDPYCCLVKWDQNCVCDARRLCGATCPVLPPQGVFATKGEYPNAILVGWEIDCGAEAYEVYRSETEDSATAVLVETVSGGNFYYDESVVPDEVYFYWIKAKASNPDRWSEFSEPDHGFAGSGSGSEIPAAKQIPQAVCDDEADVSGYTAVWSYGGDIYAYNVASGIRKDVCKAAGQQWGPRISQNLVVWNDKRNVNAEYPENVDVYAYDLTSGQEIAVTTETEAEYLAGAGVDGTGKVYVAFTRVYADLEGVETAQDPQNLHVYSYNAGSGTFVPVWNTGFAGADGYPTVSGGQWDAGGSVVTWREATRIWESGSWQEKFGRIMKLEVGVDSYPVQVYMGVPVSGPAANDGAIVWTLPDGATREQVWVWQDGSAGQETYEGIWHGRNQLTCGKEMVIFDKDGYAYMLTGRNLTSGAESVFSDMQSEKARMDENLLVWKKKGGTELYYVFTAGGITLAGDINGDGKILVSDCILALRMAVRLPITILGQNYTYPYPSLLTGAADVNGNGVVEVGDAIKIQRKVVGLE